MKTTSKKNEKKNEDDLKKNKIFSKFLLNLGANLSWGWLSSLRFLIYLVTPDTSFPSGVPCSVPVSESVCTTSADEHFPSGQHLPPPY